MNKYASPIERAADIGTEMRGVSARFTVDDACLPKKAPPHLLEKREQRTY